MEFLFAQHFFEQVGLFRGIDAFAHEGQFYRIEISRIEFAILRDDGSRTGFGAFIFGLDLLQLFLEVCFLVCLMGKSSSLFVERGQRTGAFAISPANFFVARCRLLTLATEKQQNGNGYNLTHGKLFSMQRT